jgi:hypothetical protein
MEMINRPNVLHKHSSPLPSLEQGLQACIFSEGERHLMQKYFVDGSCDGYLILFVVTAGQCV